jgi:hypothetical protein
MNILIWIGIAIALVWAYILWGRAYIIKYSATAAAFISTVDGLYARSRTILVARGYWIVGLVIGIHDSLAEAGFDWTPLTTQISDALTIIPVNMRPWALSSFFIITGIVFEWLRKTTLAPGSLSPPGSAS